MENPFAAIGAPPEGEDPRQQLLYLQSIVAAFEKTPNPRIKPLQKQLGTAIENLAVSVERGDPPAQIGQRFQRDIRDLRVQTFDLVLVVVNQFRATLRVKLQAGMAPPQRLDMELLQRALGEYAQAVRKMIGAMKKGDAQTAKEAGEMMDRANAMLDQSREQMTQSSDAEPGTVAGG